ncbi:MAG TPA: ABC transporter substrate-binding protein [Terriglobales bacterium]|nr:ABC transporter substrate-binding protein [Terriglobales bacterium]
MAKCTIVLILCLLALMRSARDAAAAEPLHKLRVAVTAISGGMSPPWAAHEAGIFAKHGLQVEVIAMPSGLQGMNTLIAREVDFVQIAGGTTAGAAVGGADVKIVATTVNTLLQNLIARPEIEKPEQLRGKNLGISRFGTSLHTGARLALRHFGMEAGRDVAIVEVGSGDWIVSAMQGGRVYSGILGYPASTKALKIGNKLLLHVPTLNIPYASTGTSTRADLIRNDPDLVKRYLSALIEAIALMKKDRTFTMKVLRKYLRTDDAELLNETYDVQIQKYLLKVPLTTSDGVRSIIDELAERNPKARDQDPAKFFDDRFVKQLDSSGFIDALYR